MFSRTKTSNSAAITTILGAGTEIIGDMSFTDTMRIDGHFDGNLKGDHLIVSNSGKVLGDVVACSCVCYGQIRGNLTLERLQVKSGGRIDGTVSTDDLEVESGALVCGEIKPKKNELRLVQEDVAILVAEVEKK